MRKFILGLITILAALGVMVTQSAINGLKNELPAPWQTNAAPAFNALSVPVAMCWTAGEGTQTPEAILCETDTPAPKTATESPTETETVAPTNTASATLEPTQTGTPTSTATLTREASATTSATVSATPTTTPTTTASATQTATATPTYTELPTATPTRVLIIPPVVVTASPTPTTTETVVPPTATATPTPTQTTPPTTETTTPTPETPAPTPSKPAPDRKPTEQVTEGTSSVSPANTSRDEGLSQTTGHMYLGELKLWDGRVFKVYSTNLDANGAPIPVPEGIVLYHGLFIGHADQDPWFTLQVGKSTEWTPTNQATVKILIGPREWQPITEKVVLPENGQFRFQYCSSSSNGWNGIYLHSGSTKP